MFADRVVATYGTFDLFHEGHLNLLRRARELAGGMGRGMLFVGVSTDEFNATKGKKAVESFRQRKLAVERSGLASVVFAEKNWEQKPRDFRRFGVELLVMGSDHETNPKFTHLEDQTGVPVLFLPRTPEISSSLLRSRLLDARFESGLPTLA